MLFVAALLLFVFVVALLLLLLLLLAVLLLGGVLFSASFVRIADKFEVFRVVDDDWFVSFPRRRTLLCNLKSIWFIVVYVV